MTPQDIYRDRLTQHQQSAADPLQQASAQSALEWQRQQRLDNLRMLVKSGLDIRQLRYFASCLEADDPQLGPQLRAVMDKAEARLAVQAWGESR